MSRSVSPRTLLLANLSTRLSASEDSPNVRAGDDEHVVDRIIDQRLNCDGST